MDPLTQARHKSYKRMIARGLSEREAAIKAGLIEGEIATPEVVTPVVVTPEAVSFEVKPDRQETSKGKVLVEVIVHLDPPITMSYRTDLRGALIKTQQTRKYLSEKFSGFLRSFLGRVDDVS